MSFLLLPTPSFLPRSSLTLTITSLSLSLPPSLSPSPLSLPLPLSLPHLSLSPSPLSLSLTSLSPSLSLSLPLPLSMQAILNPLQGLFNAVAYGNLGVVCFDWLRQCCSRSNRLSYWSGEYIDVDFRVGRGNIRSSKRRSSNS